MNRAPDWLLQAEQDLGMCRIALEAGRHEWACFAAHQSAEKALKALHLFLGQEVWGHLVARLLRELPFSAPPELVDMARRLLSFTWASSFQPLTRRQRLPPELFYFGKRSTLPAGAVATLSRKGRGKGENDKSLYGPWVRCTLHPNALS